ncbi:hypothetical protein SKAU_G00232010 [Synaphobranchus kaupii]|uniref:Uncharacterized protein n=1 Tax=Synaphobranchus kaupii TaxID=118154 RepID=A0A9Q1F5Y2_SYNKA|nr:hypothetical protein SKAU_G00232010 [Synaphobranchus kaupii]
MANKVLMLITKLLLPTKHRLLWLLYNLRDRISSFVQPHPHELCKIIVSAMRYFSNWICLRLFTGARSDSPRRYREDGLPSPRDDSSPRRVKFDTSRHQSPDYSGNRRGNNW